jgi:hypothetical protein
MLGGSHFFGENWLVFVFTSCYENLIGSLIFIFWAGENRLGYQDF